MISRQMRSFEKVKAKRRLMRASKRYNCTSLHVWHMSLWFLQRLPPERSDDLTPLTDANWVANALDMLGKYPSEATHTKSIHPRAPSQTVPAGQNSRRFKPSVSIPHGSLASVTNEAIALNTKSDRDVRVQWTGIGNTLEVAILTDE